MALVAGTKKTLNVYLANYCRDWPCSQFPALHEGKVEGLVAVLRCGSGSIIHV